MPSALEMHGVTYAYPDGTAALDGIELVVSEGERVALLGPNGAGKSTLISHTNGVLMPQAGTISVAGTPLTEKTVRSIRTQVGLVFQDPDDQLFMTTVYDDVAFGPLNMGLPAEEVDRRVHEALHAVGLADVASKPGMHLSFGQKKRIALATVLSMQPSVLVLDEPTSNLDPAAERSMIALLDTLAATMLVATHDMDLAWRLCTRAVVLRSGRVVADGPAEQIMADERLMLDNGLDLPIAVRFGGGRAVFSAGLIQSAE